ncbi:hypothetical protein BG015_000946 [Linnemannia schmuckeri]|uniref:Uncharacterized protein n=1 Tax=Linnemannia schmuckeri TaxID=64567 RepID=A0A9P5RQF9_9FUNG|nr:hypothetical protein BG015_000946 [Linnemannia schmuckeri]
MEFSEWKDSQSIKAYISLMRECLPNDESKTGLGQTSSTGGNRYALFEKFKKLVERNEQVAWKFAIEDTEDKLVTWALPDIICNLCYEPRRLHNKRNKYNNHFVKSIDSIPCHHQYQRCMFKEDSLVLKDIEPQLVKYAFGQIKNIHSHAVTVLHEPFVSKTVKNYFVAK